MYLANLTLEDTCSSDKCDVYVGALQQMGVVQYDGVVDIQSIKSLKYAPTLLYAEYIINQLIQHNYLHMESASTQFFFSSQPTRQEVILYVNEKMIQAPNINDDCTNRLWKEIGTWECEEFLQQHLNELSIPYNTSINTLKLFYKLMNNFSIGQLFNIIYGSIESTLYKLRAGQIMEQGANSYIQNVIELKASRSISEGFQYYSYGRNSKCSQSELSRYYFSTFLKDCDDYLKIVPY